MAQTATMYHVTLALSDVDRGVYETLDLRLAQHPSETMRWMLTRTIAYALSYEEGIAFSKGGLSATDDPPIAIHDPTGVFLAWIDVGTPSAERLHKASKAAGRVAVYTFADAKQIQREASARVIHKAEAIEVWHIEPAFLDAVGAKIERKSAIELTRNDENLYLVAGGETFSSTLTRIPLSPPP